MLGINPGRIVARARTRFDLRRIGDRVAEHNLKGTIRMLAGPALLRAVLCLYVLEEVWAGHGVMGCS